MFFVFLDLEGQGIGRGELLFAPGEGGASDAVHTGGTCQAVDGAIGRLVAPAGAVDLSIRGLRFAGQGEGRVEGAVLKDIELAAQVEIKA